MDAEIIKSLLENYKRILKKDRDSIAKHKDKAADLDYEEGVTIGEALITVARIEIQRIDEAVAWLDEVKK